MRVTLPCRSICQGLALSRGPCVLRRAWTGEDAHLMVPVGEGMGLTRLRRSGSGMWIFSGEICG